MQIEEVETPYTTVFPKFQTLDNRMLHIFRKARQRTKFIRCKAYQAAASSELSQACFYDAYNPTSGMLGVPSKPVLPGIPPVLYTVLGHIGLVCRPTKYVVFCL